MRPNYALITGASKGLGKVFASALAARGKNLVLVARSTNELEAIASELINSHAIKVETLTHDLATPGAGLSLAQELAERDLNIDLLVNNAGVSERGEFCELPLGRQLQMIYLNNTAILELTYELLKPMIAVRNGAVINVSSSAAFQPIPFATVYSATKAFLSSFSVGLEIELQPHNIRVVTLCPGRIRSKSRSTGEQGHGWKWPDGKQDREDIVHSALIALENGGGLVVPGLLNKFTIFAQRFIPRSVVPKLTGKFSRPKKNSTVE
jgi:short-subunit dehydrogenase